MEKKISIDAAPRYRQIHLELRDMIATGRILPGEALPSETQLRKQFKVSRFTAQQVYRLLVEEGLAVRRQGSGTFVREIDPGRNALVLQLGGLHTPGSALVQAQYRFARRVAALTGNQVTVAISHSSRSGSAAKQLDALHQGTQDMFGAASDWLEQLEPTWGVTNLPFLFKNIDHVRNFVSSAIAGQFRKTLLAKTGIRILADNWIRSSRVVLARSPCFELQDFNGLRLRVPPIPTYSLFWKALGAIPVETPWSKITEGLQNGAFDAADAPRDVLYHEGFHKDLRYVTHTRHLYSRACIVISEEKYRGLRKDIQAALVRAALETGESYSTSALSAWQTDKGLMIHEGARFILTDIEPFRKKLSAFYRRLAQFKPLIESILALDPANGAG